MFCPNTHCCSFFEVPCQLPEPEGRWPGLVALFFCLELAVARQLWLYLCPSSLPRPLGLAAMHSNHSHRNAHCIPLRVLVEGSASGNLILPFLRPAVTSRLPLTFPLTSQCLRHGSLLCVSLLSSILILKLVTLPIVVTSRNRSRVPLCHDSSDINGFFGVDEHVLNETVVMIAWLLNILKDTELYNVNVNYIHVINKKTFNVS